MATILITAFEPYDCWQENASWLALVALTRNLPVGPKIVTRRYPVDFSEVRKRLSDDLAGNYDVALHLGQAPGIGRIHLEAFGLNVGGHSGQSPDAFQPLVADGPSAYRSSLPLPDWAARIRELGIPCQVSHHAGTFLCNAVLYLTHHFIAQQQLKTRAAFIHLPLAPSQVLTHRQDWPTLPSEHCAEAIQAIVSSLSSDDIA